MSWFTQFHVATSLTLSAFSDASSDATFPAPFSDNYEFKPAGAGQAPEIVSALRDQAGTTGGTVTFECEISGTPKAEIQWFRGSKELVDTPKCTLIDKGNKQAISGIFC